MNPAFEAIVDPTGKSVRLHYSGDFSAAAMQAAAAKAEALLSTVKPGFKIFTNFKQVKSIDVDCVPHLTRMMDLCGAHGVSLIVRILPDPDRDIGINLLSIVHYRGKVKIVTVDTLAEAERAMQ